MTASTILSAIAPQFATNASKDTFLELATLSVNTDVFGEKAELATALLAAHMMAMFLSPTRSGGEAGAITSKKEGDLSVNFNSSSSGAVVEDDLIQTSYGRQFLTLMRSVAAGIEIIAGESIYGAESYY